MFLGLPDPHLGSLVRDTDPRIRIRTKMSRIPNTIYQNVEAQISALQDCNSARPLPHTHHTLCSRVVNFTRYRIFHMFVEEEEKGGGGHNTESVSI
jgi:hypothetical protein